MVFEATLSGVRSKFWIVKGRKAVQSVLRKYVTYLRYEGRPLLQPKTPDLPDYLFIYLFTLFNVGLQNS